jgi:beta-lactamase class D
MGIGENKSCWSRRELLSTALGGAAVLTIGRSALASETSERPELIEEFKSQGAIGAFASDDPDTDRLVQIDPKRAETPFIPASTFKITNSLIALETGVVKDENEIIPYGGQPQPFKQWEKDMSMRDAIKVSNVAIYQELARRIGLDRYHEWLDRLSYGNRQTGAELTRFWLDGPLQICAVEQAKFVARLAQNKLPASDRSQAIVRDITTLETKDGRTLHGKTGWCTSTTPKIGWLTGWVENGGKISSFSLNIDMATIEEAPKRLAIAKAVLGKLGVY